MLNGQRKMPHNTGLASPIFNCQKWRFSATQTYFTSWLLRGVVNQSLVLRINICGKNPRLRQARNR
jgi:hypothetical protein